MPLNLIQEFYLAIVPIVSFVVVLATIVKALFSEIRSASETIHKARRIRLVKDNREIEVSVDPWDEESVRRLLKTLGKDLDNTAPEVERGE